MSFTGLVPQPPYPWMHHPWQQFIEQITRARLAHAQLLVGRDGMGAEDMAKAMAQYLLCRSPTEGRNCGHCKSCLLMTVDGHPDLHWITPEEDSRSIKIDQIRRMSEFTANTAQQGGAKVVVVMPAEAMNANSANALLKNLEEPNDQTYFILVSEQPAFLLATIRSRCTRLLLTAPSTTQALAWLERNQVQNAPSKLNQCNGKPLAVIQWDEKDIWTQHQALIRSVETLWAGKINLLEVAKQWVQFGPVWVIEQFQYACHQTLRHKLNGRDLGASSSLWSNSFLMLPTHQLLKLYESLGQKKTWLLSSANPNTQMQMDELAMQLYDAAGSSH